MDEKGGGGRQHHDNLLKLFRLTVPKNSVGEPFCVSQNFHDRNKILNKRGGRRERVSSFPPEFFRFTVPKKFVAESLSVSLIPILIKVWIGEGGRDSQFSVAIFLSHST